MNEHTKPQSISQQADELEEHMMHELERVVEVPVAWAHSEGTRISPLRDGPRMLGEMLQIRWNALTGKYKRPR